jgi:creatinine amidohydrolase
MLLHLSTWPEIDEFLGRSKTVVVPIGSTEQHGPTGVLGTDWLCPEIIAHALHRSGEDILVAPTFNVGVAQHHLGFAGSITLRPSTFIAAICDWVSSLAHHGFERIYFLNGHGGNVAAIEAAFAEFYSKFSFAGERCPVVLRLGNWWKLPGIIELAKAQFPIGHGSHAEPSEIAVTQWAYPEACKSAILTPKIAADGPIRDAIDFRARYPDGRMGSDPSTANPEKGGALVQMAVEGLRGELRAFDVE